MGLHGAVKRRFAGLLSKVNKIVDLRLIEARVWAMNAAALDRTFDALANQPRREIVALLSDGGLSTRELAQHFRFTKQALSRHLALLEGAGVVERAPLGHAHLLTLSPQSLTGVSDWVTEICRGWTASFDRLDAILREGE
jgi:DNA-binding HxlR family transcriptional regulator